MSVTLPLRRRRDGCARRPRSCSPILAVVTESPPPPTPGTSATDAASPRESRPSRNQPVQYKGADLDAERGPGLGCFWFQVAVLAVLVVATPLTVSLGFASEVSAVLLFVTIGLLLLTGQTIIFLLRLVAADRRTRRRPLSSPTRTVGELEDDVNAADGASDVRQ